LKKRLGKLELQIMKMVWNKGNATVREVWERFYPEKKLAYTTMATMMKKLEIKGFLTHNEIDRTYVYYPTIDQLMTSQSMLGELMNNFFDGSAANLVNALINSDHVTENDLTEIEQMIRKRRGGDSDD
jgi:BlaI family transcriptional regulator, penicillinase repressor